MMCTLPILRCNFLRVLFLILTLVIVAVQRKQVRFSVSRLQPTQVPSVPSIPPPSRYRQETICNSTGRDKTWAFLCQGEFVHAMDMILAQSATATARVVQIGAHVGFEENDPLANQMLSYVKLLSPQERHRFQWTFVEPSTANFRFLQKNLASHTHLGLDLRAIQVAVVADSTINTNDMTFYSIRDTIDPVTGFDSLSKKTFPYWVTQLSSFNVGNIEFNRKIWKRLGLKMEDYIIPSRVPTKRYSDLLQDIVQGDDPATSLVLVLIDTEGFDCPIVSGMAANSSYLPPFLVFEDKQCTNKDKQATLQHLHSMGYTTYHVHENTVAYRQQDTRPQHQQQQLRLDG